MMDKVRDAVIADVPRLCELLEFLFTQEADFQPDAVKQAQGLRLIIENPEIGRILVLTGGEIITGMVNLLYTVSTALGGRVAILEDMVIDPQRRGRGAGSKLLLSAVEAARKAVCLRISLLTDRANGNAIRFYERHAFTLSEMIPLRKLFVKN